MPKLFLCGSHCTRFRTPRKNARTPSKIAITHSCMAPQNAPQERKSSSQQRRRRNRTLERQGAKNARPPRKIVGKTARQDGRTALFSYYRLRFGHDLRDSETTRQ